MHLFERVVAGKYRAPVKVTGLADPVVRAKLDDELYRTVCEQIEMVAMAGAGFDHDRVLGGKLSPVFFGREQFRGAIAAGQLSQVLHLTAGPVCGDGLSRGWMTASI